MMNKKQKKMACRIGLGGVLFVLGLLTKGVTIKFDEDGTSVHVVLAVIMKYGYSIPKVCKAVQERVKTAIENMAGLKVSGVNINIVGVETEVTE